MIPNSVTNETAHFTNWLLYSGASANDLRNACDEAEAEIESEIRHLTSAASSANDRDAEYYDEEADYLKRGGGREDALNEKVGCAVRAAFASFLSRNLPGDNAEDILEDAFSDVFTGWEGVCGHGERDYRDADAAWFVLSMMGASLNRVDFDQVGRLVRQHVAKAVATA